MTEPRKSSQNGDSKDIDTVLSAYYDSLSGDEIEEDRAWGEFAETQFPLD